jgi:hypothetical protein
MANTTSGYDWAGRQLASEFIDQLFRDGTPIETVWSLNDAGIAPYGEDDINPVFTFTLREIDAARERARRAV